tara:strand:- start:2161 stop:2457 length:297 start_codon:yes stop_codon:yes gene_type:complete
MEEKLDIILLKIRELKVELDEVKEAIESHRLEHAFQGAPGSDQVGPLGGMTPGSGNQGGIPGVPQPMHPGMGGGYQSPGQGMPPSGFPPMQDSSRPPI